MIAVLRCEVCHAELELSDTDVVAAAEAAAFTDAHCEHPTWSIQVVVSATVAERV